ncbi:ZZEF1 [Cervus elaphus hippelaphus]|uniref:ZZEF1 n=1 Tax=Cervus elaphus hippelaphus TaxID=46360 RepID=A0A212DAU7_CEREH|nr:ZZEF1 [Cervus elaphus hippelaphus]
MLCLQAFAQFDAEGDGTVDAENMLEALKNSSGANLQGELSHIIRQLQACSLVPESPGDLTRSPEMDKLKSVAKCYAYIETSSNPADIDKMTNGETSSYWQSDGSARSHWIRLKMKPDVVLRHLSIAVAATDQSYMPQQVTVAVGRTASDLQEVRDVHIPSNVTGYVTLLENANISQLYVQINIKRCLSDGCDTRIHGLRAVGFQRVKKSGVSVSDASAIWYWSLLTSLVTASMDTNPAFVQTVLRNTQKALQHMPPLSLSPGSTDFSTFLSPNVLEEVDSFLIRITSCRSTPEVELTLLAFALARGSVAKVLSSLCTVTDHLDTHYDASSLISSMALVRQNLLLKYGKPLQLTLQACDVKGKEEKSGPENLLAEPWTRDGFLTETGKTRASTIFSTGTESAFQVTQIRIMVRRGGIGAQCGLVFAYNSSSDKFHAEEHFKRFEKYDKWKLPEFRQFVKSRIGCSSDILSEDDPIGWFELEEEWDEADVKLQQCRVAKYLMVKFLCTRQESAERLGVQGLSISGYLRPARAGAEQSIVCAHCRRGTEESVCGATLLLKTLQFIQQLAHDLLLQSCFSVLQGDAPAAAEDAKAPSPRPRPVEAAKELYAHLCSVVDRLDGDSVPMEILKQEVRNTLLNGAAIFFPDRQTRRNHLFTMMKNVTEQEHKQSMQLTFRSLCTYFSDKDPGGLLLLPEKGDLANMDINEVLAVMNTLLSVAARECELLMVDGAQREAGSVLSSLFWSVQGSLLAWCYLQLKSSDSGAKDLAADLTDRYVGQFLACMRVILESLLSQYSGKTIVEKLCNSVFSMAARQLVIFLLDFCTLDISHCTLLREFSALTELLKELCRDADGGVNKLDVETWQQERPVVLHTWTKESAHNYENNCHEVSVFVSPGATYFEVEFDERCETEKRYDYLEFTDARGGKTRYDTKVGTDKWPKKVTFKAGPRLQFLFHSDSSNNEWGYKFTVTAYGLPDVAVSWGLDLQLLVSRLMGRLASQCMALKSVHRFIQACRKQAPKTDIVAGSTIDQAVNATFAALVYRTPDLYEKLQKYVNSGGKTALSEEFAQVYSLADGIRIWMLEMKQKSLMNLGSEAEEPCGPEAAEANPESLAKECYQKSLLLLKFLPTGGGSKESCDRSVAVDDTDHLQPLDKRQRTSSVVEEHFQASASPTEAAPPTAGDRSPGPDVQPTLPPSSGPPALEVSSVPAEEPSSPSTPTRRPPFTRGRLRLLSFRSMEEARPAPTVKEKYPVLKDLMDFIKDQSLSHERSLLPALSCIQTALLHLLDMGWEPSDLTFFVDIQLPDLLMKMSQENISAHDSVISQWSEEDELADAKQNSEWMDECQDGMFEAWYEKIAQEDQEKQRKMHMFIARYCDLLNVDISCDGCDEIAPWHRYRCLQCSDMDLCKTCFLGGVKPEGHGDDHEMVNMEFTHLPTHSITAHPMVTIRISDRQRLIQPYIHNYSWLLFAALALYSAHLASAEDVDGEKLDPQVLSSAATLRSRCLQLVGDCLMQAHQGKDGGSPPENQALPVTAPTQSSEEQPGKKAVQAAAEPAHAGPAGGRSVSTIFPVQSEVVISNAGHLNETYHLTLGLLGQLIIRLLPAEVDAAVTKVLSAKHNLFAAGDSSVVPDGWKTTHLLFSLGAVCLDSRVGLDWACSMAEILRSLNSAPLWRDVVATFTDHCIKQLPFQLKHTNIFTLLVLVGFPQAQLSQYSQHFAFIASHLLQTSMDSHCPEAVEATWVLSLALKGLYKTLKVHGFEETHATFLQTDLLKLLVKKCSKGTGFSKTWLLRDLEILSIMLYSSKKEINTLAEHGELELDERGDQEEEMAHDALNAPLHILRAIYELQMKRTDSFFLEVQKRFDGDELTTDERIRTLAQRWQPSRSLRLDEQSAKAVDTDMIILPCLSRPVRCEQATVESNPVTQKLISSTESELQQSYAKQRRSKSAALLHKELNCKSKRAVRDYLFRVNEATAVLYARHVLASLLAEWPGHVPVSEDILELSGPAHMTYILDMFMQLEDKHQWEKILQKVLQGCRESMLGTMALAACQFMEEPGMEVQVRESKHPYNNNTNFEDKVHIPGAIYLSIKFDPQCNTEEGCDELAMSSSSDFQQDRHNFSGSQQKWKDFELPGDTLYYRFTSDMSNTEWGYRFTVTAGHLGRFQTVEILPLFLFAIGNYLVLFSGDLCDLTLLKPLWQLFTQMEYSLFEDVTQAGILLPLHRALTELFFVTENRAQELGLLQDYLLALTTDDHLLRCAAQALQNIAAISLAINYPNKATRLWNVEC